MSFTVDYTVQFHETDAAGVVYFANGLTICHGAYEASLAAVGINLAEFFSPKKLAYPIVRATIDFWRPMQCGDHVKIELLPQHLDKSTFEVQYSILFHGESRQPVAQALTRHVCIGVPERQRHPLPTEIEDWIQRWGECASR
jgi:1,4-dihydroxy-2-naphthoyl-CoA hydrolase